MEVLLTSTDNIAILILLAAVFSLCGYILILNKIIKEMVDRYVLLSQEATKSNTELTVLLKMYLR